MSYKCLISRNAIRLVVVVVVLFVANSSSVQAAAEWEDHLPDAARHPSLSLNLWKFGPLIGLFVLWAATIGRVDSDAGRVSLRRVRWNTVLLFCALVSLLTALMLPAYLVGLGGAALAYTIPVALYVLIRNRQVDPPDRVLTWRDLKQRLFRRRRSRSTNSENQQSDGPARSDLNFKNDRVVFVGKSISRIADDTRLSEYARTSESYQSAINLVATAVDRQATDLHINPKDNEVVSRIRVDGELQALPALKKSVGGAVINIFKVLADLDISVKERAQDGSFRADVDSRRLNFRVSTQRTQVGEKMSIRILDPAQALTRLQDLGMSELIRAKLRECLKRTHGLLLICGPTGAGKSTSAYAALREADLDNQNVMSVEDPIESNMPQIDQIEVNAKKGQTFETALRSLLRQDPDILLIGEIRDSESAKLACQAATTGMLVVSTIHGMNPMSALQRLIELGVEPYSVGAAVMATLGQRLVRRLCDDCKQPYTPNEQTLKKLGLPNEPPIVLYRSPPAEQNECSTCNGRGVFRKTGIFEFLEMSPGLRKLVRGKAGETQFIVAATEHGMSTMQESALSLVTQGVISVEEYSWVLNE